MRHHFVCLAIGLIAMFAAPDAKAQTVTKHTTTGPGLGERSAPSAATLLRSIFVFGGVKDDFSTQLNTFYNDLRRFDTMTNTWHPLTPIGALPPPRAFAPAAAHAETDQIFIFGGATYQSGFVAFLAHEDMWAYSVATNRWRRVVAANTSPPARSGASMWVVGDSIYLFGGIETTLFARNDLWRYDLATNRWTELVANGAPGAPTPRHVASTGHKAPRKLLTVYGGEGDGFSGFQVLNDTWQYDLSSNTWTDVTPPSPDNIDPGRNYGAAGTIGDSLVLHGGDVPGGSSGCGAPFPQNPTNEVWQFDLLTLQWRHVPLAAGTSPKLKRSVGSVAQGKLYIFAGWDFLCPPGQIWNLDVYSYNPG